MPGDIVVLASGDKMPTDLRLLAGKGLRVNMEQYCNEASRHALVMIGELTLETAAHPNRFVRIVEAGDAVSLILTKELEHDADLIVMGKYGESIVEEMLLGSVTRHVLADSKCDVMIVR